MHLVTAKSKFRVLRYGKWSPPPKRTDQGSGNFMYINGDKHSPMFETDPFLDDCWVETSGNELKFYISDYRRYIQYLSWVFLGGSPYEVRRDVSGYYGKPFVEQIGSAVYATAIGPDTATKLLKDYVDNRDHFQNCLRVADLNAMDWGRLEGAADSLKRDLMATYDNWIRALAIASETGIITASVTSLKNRL
mgnify:CR=1 FL=1